MFYRNSTFSAAIYMYGLQIWAVQRIYIVEKLIAFIVKMAISFNSMAEIMIEIDNKYRT